MAGSIWAQAYAVGGLGLIAAFALIYSTVLAALGWLMINVEGPMRGMVPAITAWWGFYIHRNDVMIEFGLIKMSLIILAISMLMSMALVSLKRRDKTKRE